MNELTQVGIDLSLIPQEEIEAGYRGPVIKLSTQWCSTLERFRLAKNVSSLEANQEFIKRIRNWRDETATTLKIAPVNVIREEIILRIALGKLYFVDDLQQIGVRIRGVRGIRAWSSRMNTTF